MRGQFGIRGDEPVRIFIYCFNSFYHLIKNTDVIRSIAVPPDEIWSQAQKVYLSCGAVLAVPPHEPSPVQKAALTQIKGWGDRLRNQGAPLEMWYAPGNNTTPFFHCFNNAISSWVTDYENAQEAYAWKFILITAAVIVVLGCIGHCIFRHYQNKPSYRNNLQRSENRTTTAATLFTRRNNAPRESAMAEANALLGSHAFSAFTPIKIDASDHPNVPINAGEAGLARDPSYSGTGMHPV